MDRSYLSQPQVVAAARDFVCVRLTTYESAEEAKFLQTICPTRSGELENTVFTILSPDGKTELARTGRSARQAFVDAGQMARTMTRIAVRFRAQADGTPDLPTVATLRLAVDVAACDNQALVVVFGGDASARRTLVEKLKPLAWGEEFRGRFTYAEASGPTDLAVISGVRLGAGVLVTQPNRFGTAASVLDQAPGDATVDALARFLRGAAAKHRRQTETFMAHVHAGHQSGAFWETAIPVTDPEEAAVRERGRHRGP